MQKGKYTDDLATKYTEKIYANVAQYGGCTIEDVRFPHDVLMDLVRLNRDREDLIDQYVSKHVEKLYRDDKCKEISEKSNQWLCAEIVEQNRTH
jgi:hypothetical protein